MKLLTATALIFISINALANFAEFFGAGTTTSSLGNQASFESNNPENNYYAPALLAYSNQLLLSASTYYVDTNFQPIENSTTVNSVSHDGPAAVSTDYQSSKMLALHLSVPLLRADGAKLALSLIAPINYLQEFNSGDTYTPKYVMYQSRYNRTSLYANLAYPISKRWAVSAGGYVGQQISGDSFLISGTDGGPASNGQIEMKVKPVLAALLSSVYKFENQQLYLGFQQEMKSKFQNHVHGQAAPPISLLYDFNLNSLLYYDPMIVRAGHMQQFNHLKIITSLEYQFWEHYNSSVVTIERNQGMGIVNSSSNFEKISTKNILVPKIGGQYQISDQLNIRSGLTFRPTPMKGDFAQAGNSIDVDSTTIALGSGYKFKINNVTGEISSAIQYHKLKNKKVTKSAGGENGDNSIQKIGSPGYQIGGNVTSVSIGLNLQI